MPLIAESTYHAPALRGGAHLQTIYPSYFQKGVPVDYQREELMTPDGDSLLLDWAQCEKPTRELLLISHGLCGHTNRHYVLNSIHPFRRAGIDCLAWNYRGTGKSGGRTLHMTTSDSTDELDLVIRHAISKGYEYIYLLGYSMGGNLLMLYLGRENRHMPEQVRGGVAICATIDSLRCIDLMSSCFFGIYQRHFVKDLCSRIVKWHERFPEELDISGIDGIRTFRDFDNRFTCPMMGFKDADDYYRKCSAADWLQNIQRPTLLINPENDPFLTGRCYPREEAEKNPFLHLEIPASGGHCGFITPPGRDWWPAARALQFINDNIRRPLNLPEQPITREN